MRRILLFILLSAAFAVTAATAAGKTEPSLPEGRLVIVVKDGELVKELPQTTAAPAEKEKLAREEEAKRQISRLSWEDWTRRADDWGERFLLWFRLRDGELVLLALGVLATLGGLWLAAWLCRRLLIDYIGERWLKLDSHHRLYHVFQLPAIILLGGCGLILAAKPLLGTLPAAYAYVALRLLQGTLVVCVIWSLLRLTSFFDESFRRHAGRKPGEYSMNILLIDLISRSVKVLLILISLIFVLQNLFSMNVTSLLAGAGVVGLAIAFAAQETIANVFGSIMVILDKPFAVGDRIVLGEVDGVVESVGLRSTEIRSLDGYLYSIPNRKVADGVIENVTRRQTIKYAFSLGLTYGTTPEKMEEACRILHELLDHHPGFDMETLPPRIFFTDYKDWSLNLSVTVWFNTRNYIQSQEWKHEINLGILRRFNEAGLDFAFPTNTTVLTGNNALPVQLTKQS